MANFFAVHQQTVRGWQRKGCPGRNESNRYDLLEMVRWRTQHSKASGKAAPQEKEDLELEKLKLANDQARLKLERERGELVDREAAKAAFSQLLHRVRSRLEAMPQELAASIPPDLRSEYLADTEHRIRLILREMEGWSQKETS